MQPGSEGGMDMEERRATINDVAKYCGLSIATVSRIINNTDYPVSDEARRKVQQAVKELNYNPNMLGRYLKFNQSNEVGIIIPHISNYYYTELVSGINDSLVHSGYNVLLCDSYRNPEYEKKQVQYLLQKKVKGIIISTISTDTAWIKETVPDTVALVAIEQHLDNNVHYVGMNSEKGARMAVRYLYEKGHRRIAFASAPLINNRYSQRLDGFVKQIKAYRLPFNPGYFRVADSDREKENLYEFNIGKRIASNIIKMDSPPTAVVCASDMVAVGVIQELRESGCRVPEDMAVIGFDNLVISEMITPALTTIDQGIREVGAKAVEILMADINKTVSAPVSWISEPRLEERKST